MIVLNKRLFLVSLITYIVYTLIILDIYRYLPLCPDHFDYEYIAQVCIAGGSVYQDAGDPNFPGAVILHVLARLLFGDSIWSYRTLDFINLLIFVFITSIFIYRRQSRLAAIIFAPLYQAMYVVAGSWMAGERDLLATHLVVISGFLFLVRIEGGSVAWLCGVGALVWLAMVIKPTYLAYLAILLSIDLLLRRRTCRGLLAIARDQAIVVLVVGVFSAMLACWGWASGVLDDWFDMAILFNSEAYARSSRGTLFVLGSLATLLRQSWHWYTALALVGGFLWWRFGDRPSLLVIFGALVTVLSSALTQGKGFDYHFGGVLPVLGILSANCLAWLATAAFSTGTTGRNHLKVAFWITTLVVLAGLGSKFVKHYREQLLWRQGKISIYQYFGENWGPVFELAIMMRSRTSPDDAILAWNDESMVMPAVAKRRMPVRFVPPHIIAQAKSPFRHADRWQDEWEAALRERPPRIIILPDFLRNPWPNGPRAITILKEMIETRYQIIATTAHYTCFELKP